MGIISLANVESSSTLRPTYSLERRAKWQIRASHLKVSAPGENLIEIPSADPLPNRLDHWLKAIIKFQQCSQIVQGKEEPTRGKTGRFVKCKYVRYRFGDSRANRS